MSRPYRRDAALLGTWLERMQETTRLPIYLLRAQCCDRCDRCRQTHAMLRKLKRLSPRPAQIRLVATPLIELPYRLNSGAAHYRHMFTKLHGWALPCREAALLDYDAVPLRSPDRLFAACAGAPLCAVADPYQRLVPVSRFRKPRGPPKFNAGVLVLRPTMETHSALMHAVRRDLAELRVRTHAEQDLLNEHFPWSTWKPLNASFNRIDLRDLDVERDVLLHRAGNNGARWSPSSDASNEYLQRLPLSVRRFVMGLGQEPSLDGPSPTPGGARSAAASARRRRVHPPTFTQRAG